MVFPNELILEILQHLNKAQLKSVRLVSKLWSGLASEYLFATLYISSHELDLQTFTAVVQDPLLNRCVKEVVYDAVHFTPHITITEYIQTLQGQISKLASKENVFQNPDPQICQFVNMIRDLKDHPNRSRDMIADVHTKWRDFTFIQEGYRKWMDQAAFETRCFEGTAFLTLIIFGLKLVGRIRSVRLGDEWRADDEHGGEGSPLSRSWHRFHARPEGWLFLDDGGARRLDQYRASSNFWTLAFALSRAGKSGIRKLLFQTMMAPILFTKRSSEQFLDEGAAVYSGLEDLRLSFAEYPKEPIFDLGNSLHGLQRMLESMKILKRFELRLPDDYESEPPVFLSYARVFPENGHWPRMTKFNIQNLAIGTKDLITLITTKMPSLRHLSFGNIGLLDGGWEGIVEYLRVSDRISSFDVEVDSILLHRGDSIYLQDSLQTNNGIGNNSSYLEFHRSIMRSIMEYVVNWRHNPTLRHPSLRPDQPAELSLDYLRDVYRLCGMDATSYTLAELAKHKAMQFARVTDYEGIRRD